VTYEHKCPECGYEFEIERPISDKKLVPCPECGAIRTERLVSGGAGFVLVGDRWAKDGYARNGSNNDKK
jgi:putative FmdB family regulatory protein